MIYDLGGARVETPPAEQYWVAPGAILIGKVVLAPGASTTLPINMAPGATQYCSVGGVSTRAPPRS